MRNLSILVSMLALLFTVTAASAADGSGSVEPPQPRVTIEAEQTTLNAALAEVTKQTHISVVSEVPGNPALENLSLKNVPFWKAVDHIASLSHAFVASYDPIKLQPLSKDQQPPLVCYSGPFRIAVKRTSASKDFFTGVSTCLVALDIAWEPGTRLFYLIQNADKCEVRDSKNNLMKISGGSSTGKVTDKY